MAKQQLTTAGNLILYACMAVGVIGALAIQRSMGFSGALWGALFGAVGGGIGGGIGFAIAGAAGQVKKED